MADLDLDRIKREAEGNQGLRIGKVSLLVAEIERLRDGIRAHGYGIAADTPQERLERNRRLWALLDDNEGVRRD